MRRRYSLTSSAVFATCLTIMALPAKADQFLTYGDATTVSNGLQLTSTGTSPGYAGIEFDTTNPLTLNTLTTLSADYEMTQGTFGGGAPRFSISDTTNNSHNEIYVYFGTPSPPGSGTFTDPNSATPGLSNTGNYADTSSTDLRFQINGFGGSTENSNTFLTLNQLKSLVVGSGTVGDVQIGSIFLDEDGDYGQTSVQSVVVNNFQINGETFIANPSVTTPEPSTIALAFSAVPVGFLAWLRRRKRVA